MPGPSAVTILVLSRYINANFCNSNLRTQCNFTATVLSYYV